MRRIIFFWGVMFVLIGLSGVTSLVQTDADELPLNQVLPALSQGDLVFALDAVGFQAGDGRVYEEFYVGLQIGQLTYQEKNGQYQTEFEITMRLFDQGNRLVKEHTVKREYLFPEPVSPTDTRSILEFLPFALKPATYRVEMVIKDLYSDKQSTVQKLIGAESFSADQLQISEIQIANHIAVADKPQGLFIKNGIEVIPNPSRRFSPKRPTVYLYFEIYNFTLPAGGETSTYELACCILNGRTGQRIYSFPSQTVQKPGVTSARTLSFNTDTFPPGVYAVEVSVTDPLSQAVATRQGYFEVVRPVGPPPAVALTDEQAELWSHRLQYLLEPRELAMFKKLDGVGKNQFLLDYWKRTDPTPDTPTTNEFIEDLIRRYDYAENRLKGWNSDRGRVLLQYGWPEEVERHPNESGTYPYEIWTYLIDGERIFVFIDETGLGEYILRHSTVIGEIQDPNWQRWLTRGSS